MAEQDKISLDRTDQIPLYRQLYSLLKHEILNGTFQVDDHFYSENELLKMYDVSRTTVRLALKELEDEGFLQRSQGNPTIVIDRTKYVWNLYDLTDDLRRLKEKLETKVLSIKEVPLTEEIAENLQLSNSEKTVFELRRLREVQNRKMALSISYFSKNLALKNLKPKIGDDFSVTQFLRSIGEEPYVAEETLEAVNGSAEVCKLLNLPVNHAVFLRKRVTFDRLDSPLEFVISYYNPKNTKYYVRNRIL